MNALFATLSETQPKGGGGGGDGLSREEIVYEKSGDLLARMPVQYVEEEYKKMIGKLVRILSICLCRFLTINDHIII